MDKLKQFVWFSVKDGMPHRVSSNGVNLSDAFQKLSKYHKHEATNELRYITINGVAI